MVLDEFGLKLVSVCQRGGVSGRSGMVFAIFDRLLKC